ncbi:MAG: hypothetical protein ACD_73C00433G0004, partial [uncultured bacterium]
MNLFSKIRNVFQNQKGIALLIVLSSITILTIAIVEATYMSRINYRMAIQGKERLQAYYLAKSALNFSRILLKYNKEAQKLAKDNAANMGGMKLEPLYRMMPLSSNMIRGVLGGDFDALLGGGAEGEAESDEADVDSQKNDLDTGEVKQSVNMLDKEEAEKFLDFDGDFSAEITEEQTKFNLNGFAGMETQNAAYDQRKRLLLSILKLPRFDKAFEDKSQGRENLVHAIADWVDANGVINEFDLVQRGDEDSLYDKDTKVKNGKMLSLDELRLVDGMTDEIFNELKPFVTVYSIQGSGGGVNVCYADEDMAKALIYDFTHFSGCNISAIEYDDEKMKELSEEVLNACPDVNAAAAAIEAKLGLVDLSVPVTPGDPAAPNDPAKKVTPEPVATAK